MGSQATLTGSGGQILVQSLVGQGTDHVFCVPGESHLAVLDGLYDVRDRVRLVVCRHESGASNMADAYGKLTGRPGIALVTRGPGATNASIGVHTAAQDSTPVVLALPEDMLTERAEAKAAPRYQRVAAAPAPGQMARLEALLAGARSPVAILGGSGWTAEACADLRRFAEAWQLPVACAWRFQDLFDNDHPQYAGDVGIGINPKLARRVREADLALVLGPRLGEMTTSGYTLFEVPVPRQTLVHAHAGAEELGRVYAADLPIHSAMPELAAALAQLRPPAVPAWAQETAAARAEYVAWNAPVRVPGPLQMAEIVGHLRERLPPDAIVTNGAGNFSTWAHRFYRFRRFKTQLAPTSGAMGYGVPAAVAAKAVHPGRIVVAFAGDGDFLMTGQELATAVQHDLPVIVIVVNNGAYGTIRMHQERHYPGRVHGTHLTNPDFAAYARSFGASGELVESTEQFAPAFERALSAGRPALLELRLSEEVITPTTTLSAIREQALKKRGG